MMSYFVEFPSASFPATYKCIKWVLVKEKQKMLHWCIWFDLVQCTPRGGQKEMNTKSKIWTARQNRLNKD